MIILHSYNIFLDWKPVTIIIYKSSIGFFLKDHTSNSSFLLISGYLLKDSRYAEDFSEPKPYYNVPEKDKLYEWIVPSAELLRAMGLDIRGENNIDMFDFF